MTPPARNTSARSDPLSREVLIVGLLTLAGAVLRLWGLPRLGLAHFDEGIYALAGLWSVSPQGLAGLDPTLIPYAPPGFPFLVGIVYLGLGVSDLAAILVSILTGTLTIPAAAWLARRTSGAGAGAGAAAAALVAFSGFHVVFSRVALTDVSVLLCWILALVCGQRFLERPRFSSAIALGLSVGLAQWFKYNGWLLGVFVVLAACLGILVDPKERHRPRIRAVWGFGLIAVLVAIAVYWPWFAFVEANGGYAGLLKHHQSYMGGFRSWLPHLRLQLEQMAALSGGPAWNLTEYLAAVLCCALVLLAPGKPNRYVAFLVIAIFALVTLVSPFVYGLIGAGGVFDPRYWRSPGKRLLVAAGLGLSVLTPFYHPYARLWLPLLFLGWIMMADLIITGGFPLSVQKIDESPSVFKTGDLYRINIWEWFLGGFILLFIEFMGPGPPTMGPGELPGPLAASDSLRNSVRKAVADLPAGTPGLRLLARPPVTFYLGGRVQVPVQVEPDLGRLLAPGNPRFWALVDLAQVRQEGDPKTAPAAILDRWVLVREYPTQLSIPALLDTDPGAARAGRSESLSAPLWLLRPRTAGPA